MPMTPLANQLIKQQVLMPARKREAYIDPDGCLKLLSDFHCFEVTDVMCSGLPEEIAGKMVEGMNLQTGVELVPIKGIPPTEAVANAYIESLSGGKNLELHKLIFLPARKTWLEWICRERQNKRLACLVMEKSGELEFYMFDLVMARYLFSMIPRTLLYCFKSAPTDKQKEISSVLSPALVGVLALINSPRIFGRVQHMPHRGMERKLTLHFGVGKFPLHAWTELKLVVAKPPEIDDGEPHEAHLTGKRALHFVRKHIRIRLGKLEYVTSHWRGDAAIGMKQTRYKVTV